MTPPAPTSPTPAYDALSKKQREWVDLYFTMGRSHTAVSRSMGYKAPEQHGWRMSKNVDVRAAIQERLAALEIRANDVLYRIDQRANATAEDLVEIVEVERATRVEVPAAERIEQLHQEAAHVRLLARRIAEAGLDDDTEDAAEEDAQALEREAVRLAVALEFDPGATASVPGPPEVVLETRVSLLRLAEAGQLHLVKSVKEDRDGVKVELHDAAHADDVLAKVLGLTGPTGTEHDPVYERRIVEIINVPQGRPADG